MDDVGQRHAELSTGDLIEQTGAVDRVPDRTHEAAQAPATTAPDLGEREPLGAFLEVEPLVAHARVVVGHQGDADVADTEQIRRIDVATVDPRPEVERAPRGGDRVARTDDLAPPHSDRGHERVAGAEPVAVVDGDVQRPGDRTGEDDDAVTGGSHGGTGGGAVLDAPVAGTVGPVGHAKRIDDRGVDRWSQHPFRGPGARSGADAGEGYDGHSRGQLGQDDDDGQRAVHGHPRARRGSAGKGVGTARSSPSVAV